MIKSVFLLVIFGSFSYVHATDSACLIKQKNAASFEFAQSAAVPVQEVQVIEIRPGHWTNNPSENIGTDQITILGNRPHGPTSAAYLVTAKQIGTLRTCTILKVER